MLINISKKKWLILFQSKLNLPSLISWDPSIWPLTVKWLWSSGAFVEWAESRPSIWLGGGCFGTCQTKSKSVSIGCRYVVVSNHKRVDEKFRRYRKSNKNLESSMLIPLFTINEIKLLFYQILLCLNNILKWHRGYNGRKRFVYFKIDMPWKTFIWFVLVYRNLMIIWGRDQTKK